MLYISIMDIKKYYLLNADKDTILENSIHKDNKEYVRIIDVAKIDEDFLDCLQSNYYQVYERTDEYLIIVPIVMMLPP